MPRVRIELTTPASSWLLDYIITRLSLLANFGGAGRWCKIIVGTHLLVSTPAFAKATAGKPSKVALGLLAIHSLPAKDWLGVVSKMFWKVSPNSPSFSHDLLLDQAPKIYRAALYH